MKKIIVAVDSEYGFAKDNVIPWNVPEDFAHFMRKTKGDVCIMGRHTYQEIVQMKKDFLGERYSENTPVLASRFSIVLSNTMDSTKHNDCMVAQASVAKLADMFNMCSSNNEQNISFLGGYDIFVEALDVVDEIIMTHLPINAECTSFFPFEAMIAKGFKLTKYETLETKSLGAVIITTYTRPQ